MEFSFRELGLVMFKSVLEFGIFCLFSLFKKFNLVCVLFDMLFLLVQFPVWHLGNLPMKSIGLSISNIICTRKVWWMTFWYHWFAKSVKTGFHLYMFKFVDYLCQILNFWHSSVHSQISLNVIFELYKITIAIFANKTVLMRKHILLW